MCSFYWMKLRDVAQVCAIYKFINCLGGVCWYLFGALAIALPPIMHFAGKHVIDKVARYVIYIINIIIDHVCWEKR